MAGLLNIFNLGSKGVNVDSSPIHMEDGELTKAQNAVRDPLGSDGGIRKRPGLTKLNASAGGGGTAVLGMVNIAHEFDYVTTLYVGVEALGVGGVANPLTKWRKSTNGTTWTSETTPSRLAHAAAPLAGAYGWKDLEVMISHRNKLYYASDEYIQYPNAGFSSPPIKMWDGLIESTVGYIPYNNALGSAISARAITSFAPYSADEFIVTTDDGGAGGTAVNSRVFLFNPTTGTIRQIGPAVASGSYEFGASQILCAVTHLGRIWVAGEKFGTGSAGVYFCRPDYDATWTLDATPGGSYNIRSLCVYKGELYAGSRALLGNPGIIFRRDTTGAWTTSLNVGNSSSGWTICSALTVFGDYLYALVWDDAGVDVSARTTIRRFDGTTWSIVWTLDEGGQESRTQQFVGMGLVAEGALYFVIPETDAVGTTDPDVDGIVLRSTNGTGWVEVDTFTNLRGSIGFIRR